MPAQRPGAPGQGDPPQVEELTIEDLVAHAEAIAAVPGRALLGVAGPPGAGKSTVAAALGARLGAWCAVVGMDGFHLAQAELVRLGRADRKGAPDTFDAVGYAQLIRRLRANTDPVVYAPAFRRDLEEPIAGSVAVPQNVSLVITEGNYLLSDGDGWREVRRLLDEVWYLYLPDEVRIERLVRRHEGHGRDPVAARAWVYRNDEANALVIQARMAFADRVILIKD